MEEMTKKEIKNKQKAWITKGILKTIQVKTRWLKTFMRNKNKSITEYNQYKLYRDKINHLIRASKKTIINHTPTSHQKDMDRHK